MLQICVGSDFVARKNKIQLIVNEITEKHPHAQLINLEVKPGCAQSQLQQYMFHNDLFQDHYIIKCTSLCEAPEDKEFFLKNLSELRDCPHNIIISEQKLNSRDTSILKKNGVQFFVYENEDKTDNLFYLGDALLNNDKKQLWTHYTHEIRRGTDPHAIMGILIWQMQSLVLAKSQTQDLSGLSMFVYNKCSKNPWTNQQSQNLYKQLILITHQSRQGGTSLKNRLERLILNL